MEHDGTFCKHLFFLVVGINQVFSASGIARGIRLYRYVGHMTCWVREHCDQC